MKQFKTLVLSLTVIAGALVPLTDAAAWVAARGGFDRGGVAVGGFHGGVAVGGYHGAYYGGYHGGCYGCGAAAGAVAGMAVGAAIASSAYNTYPSTVVVQQPAPVYVQPPAYAAGNMPIGTQLAALPAGAGSMVVNGVTYYQAGPTWFKPYFGSSGVYYEVVPAP